MKLFQIVLHNIDKAKPLGIVGKAYSGKSSMLKVIGKDILKKKVVYFNSAVLATYRELYGIYDPMSTT
jgi:ABC-type polysaccharide/polyol phosphate transport system ATPase subunit